METSQIQWIPYYYVKDLLGNIRYIIDKNSTVIVSYNYDAWGNTQVTLNTTYSIAHGKTVLIGYDPTGTWGFWETFAVVAGAVALVIVSTGVEFISDVVDDGQIIN